jgi:hypothetical protein
MTAIIIDSTANKVPNPDIFYPSSDGEPLAESYDHLYVIMTTPAMLLAHLNKTLPLLWGGCESSKLFNSRSRFYK